MIRRIKLMKVSLLDVLTVDWTYDYYIYIYIYIYILMKFEKLIMFC